MGIRRGFDDGQTAAAFAVTLALGNSIRGPGAPATAPKHHYTFELFALDTKLDVQPGTDGFATRVEILKAINGHILGKAVYMGLFHRPQ